MKLSKYFMMAAASLALFACSNDEDIPGLNGEGTKSVYLKFEGLSTGTTTRVTDVAKSEGAIVFDNITVYFTDASGAIQETQSFKQSDDADAWNNLATAGHLFHGIPNTVEQVYVVGNAAEKGLTGTNISDIKAQSLQVAKEQDFEDVILFGEDESIEPVTDGDNITDDQGHTLLYKAEVTLAPFVSRFEIAGIQCEDITDSKYQKIVLQAIGLMDYNNQFTLGGGKSEEMTITNILEPGSAAEEGKFIFGETTDTPNGAYTNYSWAWDKITGNVTLDANEDVHYPSSESNRYVYQFCPLQITGNKNVQIKLAVDAYTDDSTIDLFGGVVTAKFQKQGTSGLEDVTAFEAGKIYKIDSYKFKVENVKPWNPDEEICVNVVVKVQDWEVVALTPVFE